MRGCWVSGPVKCNACGQPEDWKHEKKCPVKRREERKRQREVAERGRSKR